MHCHGQVKNNLDTIMDMGLVGLNPLEPPGLGGDITLREARTRMAKRMFIMGNIEMGELEHLDEDTFTQRIKDAIRDATAGDGYGFILAPTSFPIDRVITPRLLRNYEIMVEQVEALS